MTERGEPPAESVAPKSRRVPRRIGQAASTASAAGGAVTTHLSRVPRPNPVERRMSKVLRDTDVVGIDEGQFFDADLPLVCNQLADTGKRVVVAGLDTDYLGKPFEPIRTPSKGCSCRARRRSIR